MKKIWIPNWFYNLIPFIFIGTGSLLYYIAPIFLVEILAMFFIAYGVYLVILRLLYGSSEKEL